MSGDHLASALPTRSLCMLSERMACLEITWLRLYLPDLFACCLRGWHVWRSPGFGSTYPIPLRAVQQDGMSGDHLASALPTRSLCMLSDRIACLEITWLRLYLPDLFACCLRGWHVWRSPGFGSTYPIPLRAIQEDSMSGDHLASALPTRSLCMLSEGIASLEITWLRLYLPDLFGDHPSFG
jgi:predicted signal transduction protein with EAL and GGDEF domain